MMDAKTKKEYLRLHWLMWNWLAVNPDCEKFEAFDFFNWDYISFFCWLCRAFQKRNPRGDLTCPECPLRLSSSGVCDNGHNNYYDLWKSATTDEAKAKYALLIRDVVPKPEGV